MTEPAAQDATQGLQPAEGGDEFDQVWDELSSKHNSGPGDQGPGGPDQDSAPGEPQPQDGPSKPTDPSAAPSQGPTEPGGPQAGQEGGQGGGDPEGQPQEHPPADPDQTKDDVLRKAHGYDSMLGRLEKERQAKKELEQRLARYEQSRQSPPDSQSGQIPDPGTSGPAARPQDPHGPSRDDPRGDPGDRPAEPPAKAEIPDELREEVQEFQQRYPDYAELVETDSPEGERVRNILRQYGPDLAATQADNVQLRTRLESETSQVRDSVDQTRQEIAREKAQEHWSRIGSQYPELHAVQQSSDREGEFRDFLGRLNGWIEDQPLREARRIAGVVQNGNADQVLEVLGAYARDNGQDPLLNSEAAVSGNPPPEGPNPQAGYPEPQAKDSPQVPAHTAASDSADAAAAVPSRPGPPPSPKLKKEDFDAAWEARTRKHTT